MRDDGFRCAEATFAVMAVASAVSIIVWVITYFR